MSEEKLPISAVMVIYNEEKLLEKALESFYDLVDEIIIVHDGRCDDKSLEIARKYTDKIFELEHIGEAEWHRPFTYQIAKNDWILQVDADEFLSDDLRNNLENLIKSGTDIFEVSWPTYFRGKHYYWLTKRALFRKSRVYFIGVSHETVLPVSEKVVTEKTSFPLMHEPLYDNYTFPVLRKKWRNWARIQASQLLKEFSSIPKWNCPLSDWYPSRKVKIDHPIIFGIIGTSTYNSFIAIWHFFLYRKLIVLKLGLLALVYHWYLNIYLLKLKKTGKKKNNKLFISGLA